MKFLLFSLILLAASCATTNYSTSKQLHLESASQQTFVKGKQSNDGTTSGTNYKLAFDKFQDVTITRLWLRKQAIEFSTFEHEELLYLTATRYSAITINKGDAVPAPFEYEGKALVEYEFKGKKSYLTIADFEVKEASKGK